MRRDKEDKKCRWLWGKGKAIYGSQDQMYMYYVVIKKWSYYFVVFRHSRRLFCKELRKQILNAYKTPLLLFEASGEGLAQSQSSRQANTEYAQVCHKGNFWCESYVIQYLHKCKVVERSSFLNIKTIRQNFWKSNQWTLDRDMQEVLV